MDHLDLKSKLCFNSRRKYSTIDIKTKNNKKLSIISLSKSSYTISEILDEYKTEPLLTPKKKEILVPTV